MLAFFEKVILHWPSVAGVLALLASVLASAHVVLYKRDSRSAAGWVGLIWLAPVVGAILYLVFGINRIERRSRILKSLKRLRLPELPEPVEVQVEHVHHYAADWPWEPLARLSERYTRSPLLRGNHLEPLVNGDEAFPRMLAAIAAARETISVSSYIFDNDAVGRMFVEALAAAKERGVQVRVLVDDFGVRYSFPSIIRELRRAELPYGRFLRTLRPLTLPHLNLRKHRKALVIDGKTAFTGGLNLREGHWLSRNPKRPIQDLHFILQGPVVSQMQQVFVDDWLFTTGEVLRGREWFPIQERCGDYLARAVYDGPDENLDALPFLYLGALGIATRRVQIMTPYFLPDPPLMTALVLAAARGVCVEIYLPERNNLPFVQWAANAQLGALLDAGCKIWLTAPPFAHTKLFVVDESWAFVGSPNWDPRSLRLNFELGVEVYPSPSGASPFAALLVQHLNAVQATAKPYTLQQWRLRSLGQRFRDGFSRLFTPYL